MYCEKKLNNCFYLEKASNVTIGLETLCLHKDIILFKKYYYYLEKKKSNVIILKCQKLQYRNKIFKIENVKFLQALFIYLHNPQLYTLPSTYKQKSLLHLSWSPNIITNPSYLF